MSLKKYTEKRHFDRTPEPLRQRACPSTGGSLQYCVQRHHATHLHYDLRLEVGGRAEVLGGSQGPDARSGRKAAGHDGGGSSDRIRRLRGRDSQGELRRRQRDAVGSRARTSFWATPRRKNNLRAAISSFACTAKRSRGEFAIVRMKRGKGNEWLLLKKKDAAAQPGWDTGRSCASAF